MAREPQILTEARELVSRTHAGGGARPTRDELTSVQARLHAMIAHPSTGGELRQRFEGVALVVSILIAASADAPLQRAS